MTKILQLLIVVAIILVGLIIIDKSSKPEEVFPFKESEEEYKKSVGEKGDWKEVISDKGFKILMPSEPISSTESTRLKRGGQVLFTTYTTADEDGATYLVSAAMYPPDAAAEDPNIYLQTVLRALTASSGTEELIRTAKLIRQGYPGLDFSFRQEGKIASGILVMVENYLFIAIYMVDEKHYQEETEKRYLNSLEITRVP
jgi:hypothetical protein